MNHLAKNLRHLRRNKNLSQEEFARQVGLNRGNIASYEKGSAEPNIGNLTRIAKYFNIDLNDLIERDLSYANNIIKKIDRMEDEGNTDAQELLKESLENQMDKIELFRRRSDEMARILEGFRQFHKFRMENQEQLSDDVKKMALDYEKLLDVLEEVLSANKKIIRLLES
jgi:transcriptional regulator with XRE-family HTH domain